MKIDIDDVAVEIQIEQIAPTHNLSPSEYVTNILRKCIDVDLIKPPCSDRDPVIWADGPINQL